jgi:hypothetical protein
VVWRLARLALALLICYLALGYLTPRVAWLSLSRAAGGKAPVRGALFGAPSDLRRVAGALAVHTERSHDAIGTDAEAIAAAKDAGLDFVILSDHRSRQTPDSLWSVNARFDAGVLLVRGQEVSLGGDVGRVLTFGLDTALTRWDGGLQAFASRLERDSATAIVAHSRSPRLRDSWRATRTPAIAGWEVFDLADIGRERLEGPWVVYHLLALAASAPLDRLHWSLIRLFREGFDQPAVAAFDSLYERGDITALAGLDAHPKTRVFGHLVPAYEPLFKSLINYIALEEAGPGEAQAAEATARLARALEHGRAYISFGDAEAARRFRLRLGGAGHGWVGLGAPAEWRPGLMLEAGFDGGGERRLIYRVLRDGEALAWLEGPDLSWRLSGVGAYRVEVYRYTLRIGPFVWNLRPWIFANPNRVVNAVVGGENTRPNPTDQ